jgi:hypothetical protein
MTGSKAALNVTSMPYVNLGFVANGEKEGVSVINHTPPTLKIENRGI